MEYLIARVLLLIATAQEMIDSIYPDRWRFIVHLEMGWTWWFCVYTTWCVRLAQCRWPKTYGGQSVLHCSCCSSHSCSHFSPANNTHTLCTLHMQVWLIWCVRTGLYAEWLALFCGVIYFCIFSLLVAATKCPTPHWTPHLLQAQGTNGHNCLSSQLHVCTHRTVWMWRNSSPLHHNMKLTHRVYYCVCVYMPNCFVLSMCVHSV